MELIASERGHVVYTRCPTYPPMWEAACECGYRSSLHFTEADAAATGRVHAEGAPDYKAPKPIITKPKARAKTARKK